MSGFASRLKSTIELALARRRSRLDGKFDTHDAARVTQDQGYEDRRLTELVVARTARFAETIARQRDLEVDESGALFFAAVQAAAASTTGDIHVLDFGGAAGAHFHLARRWLPERTIRWCVVETPAMGAAATPSARDGLEFQTSIEAAVQRLGRPQLVYANNSIQYSTHPLATLGALLGVAANVACLSKLPLASVPRLFFTRQQSWLSENGPGAAPAGLVDARVTYPLGILSRETVFEAIASHGTPQLHTVRPEKMFHRDCGLIEYHSFVSRGKSG